MATIEAPDPQTFESWEDAFRYPIPTVRRMEQQLRADRATNREKLRNLVGANYRDLLGTAERIMSMNQAMQSVESNLGRVSSRCNARILDKKSRNFTGWRRAIDAHGIDPDIIANMYLMTTLTDS